jgi:putative Holliday junction resolvase
MKILGIDYGRSKIGLAVGDTVVKLAEPLIVVSNFKLLIFNFKSILNDQKIEKIIIGIPGGEMDEEIKKFGENLKKETELPVEYFDETLTTQDAQRILIEGGGKRKRRKEKEDAVAAAIMLEWYLENYSG